MRLFEIAQRVWWHGSYQPNKKIWRPFAHFGTWRAAVQRFWSAPSYHDRQCYFYPVILDIRKTIQVPDIFEDNTASHLYHYFDKNRNLIQGSPHLLKMIEDEDLLVTFSAEALYKALGKALMADGINTITYKNRMEDRWSISVIVIDPQIISPAGQTVTVQYSELEKDKFGFLSKDEVS